MKFDFPIKRIFQGKSLSTILELLMRENAIFVFVRVHIIDVVFLVWIVTFLEKFSYWKIKFHVKIDVKTIAQNYVLLFIDSFCKCVLTRVHHKLIVLFRVEFFNQKTSYLDFRNVCVCFTI